MNHKIKLAAPGVGTHAVECSCGAAFKGSIGNAAAAQEAHAYRALAIEGSSFLAALKARS